MSHKTPCPPEADVVRAAREALGLTQEQAAAVVHVDARTWRKWELREREMHPAFYELFVLKTGWRDAMSAPARLLPTVKPKTC